jgi:hypothetical protein
MKNVVFVITKNPYNIFFECPLAKVIWRIIHVTFRLAPPKYDFVFNKSKNFFLASYSYGYRLDLYVALSPTRGAAGNDGFCVQPFGYGNSGFIQPVWVAIT